MNRRVRRRRRPGGFTLMEVLLVMAILVIIGSIATVSYVGIQNRTKRNNAKVQINALETAVGTYTMTFGDPPNSLDELINGPTDATKAKDFEKGEIWPKDEIPLDPWGNKYQMNVGQNNQVLIYSIGKNGQDEGGKGDDVVGG